ncbi:hypothetical protein TrST_g1857 [Triparma strigata]|uniref:Uncharacterized protein n=1 Tax=Triparma strigata TaxID=1606541 RepID=A0A9W7BGN0_9STRA|nr:hypothetical protein TrST_g1857 [Triparma strigata]
MITLEILQQPQPALKLFALQTLLRRSLGMPLENLIDFPPSPNYPSMLHPVLTLLSTLSLTTSSLLYINTTLTLGSLLLRLYQSSPPLRSIITSISTSLPFSPVTKLSVITGTVEAACRVIGGKRISIDPKFLTDVYNQFIEEDVQAEILDIVKQSVSSNNPSDVIEVYRTMEIIASCIPLSSNFIKEFGGYTNDVMLRGDEVLRGCGCRFLMAVFEVEEVYKERERKQKKGAQPRQKMPSFDPSFRLSSSLTCTLTSLPTLLTLLPTSSPTSPGNTPISVLTTMTGNVIPTLYNLLITQPNPQTLETLNSLTSSFKSLTLTPHAAVRSLIYEPLDLILSDLPTFNFEMLNFFCHCSHNLAKSTQYPPRYFDDPEREYDYGLEVERNDVRELVRQVGEREGGVECFMDMLEEDESGYHIFSALAKPLSTLVKNGAEQQNKNDRVYARALQTLHRHLQTSSALLHSIVKETGSPIPLPTSVFSSHFQTLRLTCLSLSSHGVYLHPLSHLLPPLLPLISSILNSAVEFTINCSTYIREYPQLEPNINFIKMVKGAVSGEFHSPGGEDHLGCLALNRFCTVKSPVSVEISSKYTKRIFEHHEELLLRETSNISQNIICTSKSRRLLLQSLCKLCLISSNTDVLTYLLSSRIQKINLALSTPPDTTTMHNLTESILDISEFDSSVLESNLPVILSLTPCATWGYTSDSPQPVLSSWGRVRASYSKILTTCLSKSKTDPHTLSHESGAIVANEIAKVANKETETAVEHFKLKVYGGIYEERLFVEDVIGSEKLEAGAFLNLMGGGDVGVEVLGRFFLEVGGKVVEMMALHLTRDLVGGGEEEAGKNKEEEEEEEEYEDPRNGILEGFYGLAVKVMEGIGPDGTFPEEFEERLAEVVGVFIADWTISRGKNSGGPCPGLDPDDPATLLLLEFLPLACRSANVLTKVAQKFTDFVASTQPSAILRISTSSPHSPQPPPPSTPPPVVGAGLVISALLNGASGRAPPWALEFMPSTFGGLFQGLGNNTASLLLALKIGSFSYFEMRPPSPARVLSGKYVSRLKPAAYNDLENCVKACADSGRGGKWKDLKNALKMATGRKKKSTTYKLKPSKRSYENQRL